MVVLAIGLDVVGSGGDGPQGVSESGDVLE